MTAHQPIGETQGGNSRKRSRSTKKPGSAKQQKGKQKAQTTRNEAGDQDEVLVLSSDDEDFQPNAKQKTPLQTQ